MNRTRGQIEIDELNDETFALLGKRSLGDRIRAYERFKEDPDTDKVLLEKLLGLVKKEYSAKFMQGIMLRQMLEEESDEISI